MFQDNKDFYPTPKKLINKMIEGIDFKYITSILEPSAGKGDIVEVIKENIKAQKKNGIFSDRDIKYDIDCIEIDENLRVILQSKEFRVIYDNFLNYNGFKKYDLIIANFPFSEGDKHLSHALDLIEGGGQLVCLINAETIRNPYSNLRKVLLKRLNKYNANIKYLQEEFINAERKTNVEVALIKVKIKNRNNDSIILENLKQEELLNQEEQQNNSLIDGDFLKGIIQQYDFEIKAGIKLINEYKKLQSLMLKSFKDDFDKSRSILKLDINNNKISYYTEKSRNNLINEYIENVRYKYWEALFNNEKFTSLLTSNLLHEFRQKLDDLKNYDFSLYNIKELQKQMNQNVIMGVEETILSLFNEFSYEHSWYKECKNNIHYYNGWATNKAHIINKKVIIPLSAYGIFGDRLDYGYKFYEKMKDIERVFDYLDGGQTEETNLKEILDKAEKEEQTKNIKTKYFSINTYKKGTTHLTFLNKELLKKFNIFGSLKKNFLPPSYGKKEYNSMSEKEKQVVDEFEGKQNYEKAMKNLDYYIYKPNQILMLQ